MRFAEQLFVHWSLQVIAAANIDHMYLRQVLVNSKIIGELVIQHMTSHRSIYPAEIWLKSTCRIKCFPHCFDVQ